VTNEEVEEAFNSGNAIPLGIQISPLVDEERLTIVGPTKGEKLIMVVFTMREGRVRPISARVAHRKERKSYEEILRKIAQRSGTEMWFPMALILHR
jgi:uncharacterized DUF497 family protein